MEELLAKRAKKEAYINQLAKKEVDRNTNWLGRKTAAALGKWQRRSHDLLVAEIISQTPQNTLSGLKDVRNMYHSPEATQAGEVETRMNNRILGGLALALLTIGSFNFDAHPGIFWTAVGGVTAAVIAIIANDSINTDYQVIAAAHAKLDQHGIRAREKTPQLGQPTIL